MSRADAGDGTGPLRLGTAWNPRGSGFYRSFLPLKAMQHRGHEVVWPPSMAGEIDVERLADCDVVHLYRYFGPAVRDSIAELSRRGVAITWDNDDDFAATPEESPLYATEGGVHGERNFRDAVRDARRAQVVTVTTEALAERYRESGLKRVEVVPNCLPVDLRRRSGHRGVVIGWVAGLEHQADASRLGIADALRRVQDKHPDVFVECIGVDLGLSERYRHDGMWPFLELPKRMGGFDIGIAPVADLPFNRVRSDIKVKEYAASGAPWLASRLTPYAHLGPEQGGELVDDDGWFDALDRLVGDPVARRALAAKGRAWAKTQTINAVADRWESIFRDAVAAKRGVAA